MEEQQQNKSTRSFEEWRNALVKLITDKRGHPITNPYEVADGKIKPYYDQGLQPSVCFKELFNR